MSRLCNKICCIRVTIMLLQVNYVLMWQFSAIATLLCCTAVPKQVSRVLNHISTKYRNPFEPPCPSTWDLAVCATLLIHQDWDDDDAYSSGNKRVVCSSNPCGDLRDMFISCGFIYHPMLSLLSLLGLLTTWSSNANSGNSSPRKTIAN